MFFMTEIVRRVLPSPTMMLWLIEEKFFRIEIVASDSFIIRLLKEKGGLVTLPV